MSISKKKLFTILLVSLLVVTFISAIPPASARYKSGRSAYVSYRGRRMRSNGMKYYYKVYSGRGSQRIRYWKLKSSAFKHYDVVWASESFRQYGSTLKFTKAYRNMQVRWVKFTLGKEYKQPGNGHIKRYIKVQYMKTGWIKGPVMPNS